MIKYLYINNYKSFVNFMVEFDQIALLVGKNGSGKSNVFDVIGKLCSFISGNEILSIDKVFHYSSLTRWMKSNIQIFELGLCEGDKEYVYKLEITQDEMTKRSFVNSEELLVNGYRIVLVKDRTVFLSVDGSEIHRYNTPWSDNSNIWTFKQDSDDIDVFISAVNRIIICSPNPKTMMSTVDQDNMLPQNDFSNIGSVCADLFQSVPEAFIDLGSVIREINPTYVQAKIVPGQYNKRLSIEYRFKDVKCIFDFEELSDGEKALFAIYLLIYAYLKRGYTLLLDEPDNFVSLREIQAICMSIEEAVGEAGQCLLISHNADVINYFTDQAGIWFDRNTSGESKIIDNPYKANQEQILTYSEFISRGIGEMDEA